MSFITFLLDVLALRVFQEPSSPSHPSLGVGQQDKNITNGAKKQKYVRASVKNICSGKPAKIYGRGRPEVLLKSARYFSPVLECVVADCWNRAFPTPPCHQTPVVVVIIVVVVVLYPPLQKA